MTVWTISPENVRVLVGGVYEITGFPQGTFVNIRKNVPSFTLVRTADGQIARTYRKDNSFIVDLTIVQASPSNDILSKLIVADQFTKNAFFPLFIKDDSGRDIFFSTASWIETYPRVSYSDNVEVRNWTIQCGEAFIHVGGAGESSTATDILNLGTAATDVLERIFS